jgi:hypothetical protein
MYNELLKEKVHILEEEKRKLSGLLKRFGQEADNLKRLVETDKILTLACKHYFDNILLNTVVTRRDDGSEVCTILTSSACTKCGCVRILKEEL